MNLTQMLIKRIPGSSQLIFTVLVLSLTAFAAGEADPTFNTNVGKFAAESANALALQPDGKILVGGNFTTANGLPRIGIARFNADGSLDASFNAGNITVNCSSQPCPPAPVNVIALQADGKIIIGGEFTVINGLSRIRIVRLNSDGSLDTSFLTFPGIVNGTINAITVQPDGKVLVGGNFNYQTIVQGTVITRTNLIRLNSDGSYDSTFGFNAPGNVADIILQPDGKIIIGGGFGSVARLNSDGTPDSTFTNLTVGNGAVNSLVLQPDGKVIVGGSFNSIAGVQQNYIARLNSNGTLDATFNAGGLGASQTIKDVALATDGRIIIVGDFISYNTVSRFRAARLNADGSLDTSFSFNPSSLFFPTDVLILPDGKIIISGTNGSSQPGSIFRLNPNGSPDTGFAASVALSTPANVYDLSLQTDGKILVGGDFTTVNDVRRTLFARVNPDGSVDTNFVPNLASGGSGDAVYASAQQADGKILVGGQLGGSLGTDLQRLNADGSRDTTFSVPIFTSSAVYALAVLPNGKILAGGAIYSSSGSPLNLVRLNSDGSIDASFSVTVNGEVRDIFLQSDGKILIGGNFTSVNGALRGRVARFNADGTLDLSFNPLSGANSTVYAVAQQTDGRVLIAGIFTSVNGTFGPYIARLNTDGSLDNSFNSSNGLNAPVYALTLQPDGRILIGGNFTAVNNSDLSSRRLRYARLLSNGVADPAFDPGGSGANDIVQDVLLLPSGAVLIGGHFTRVGEQPHVGLARVINSFPARTAFDFDGDGRADIAVFRPSNGFWYRINSQTNTFSAVQFGQAGDQIAPADYDGDGKTDIAVFRPGAFGYFYILNSADNSFRAAQFGTTGDVPMSGEWDGDGKADLAVYREGVESKFYYRPSARPNVDYQQIDLGTAGDKPVYGDWSGDGMLDAVVFRPSNANFYFRLFEIAFGTSTDVPFLADFDGNGRASLAVFRPSNGTWYTSTLPQINYGAVPFGTNGDLPVPADYDGDGQTDIAVFRPSNGGWYLNRTTSGFAGVQFGSQEDKPIPNAYIR